jgi:hypothetical protein
MPMKSSHEHCPPVAATPGGAWGVPRPSVAAYVTVTAPTGEAIAAGCR